MPVASPCVKQCSLGEASGLCQGCGRTLDEIARWSCMDEAERQAIMAELSTRMAASHMNGSVELPSRNPAEKA